MATLTLETLTNTTTIEVPDRYTFESKGVPIDFDLDELCQEGLAKLWWHAKRWITDGSKSDTSEAEHEAYIGNKLNMLRGLIPFGATRSGDKVANKLRAFVTNALVESGMKRKEVPKLGADVAAVRAKAESLGLEPEWLDRAQERAEAIVELESAPLDVA